MRHMNKNPLIQKACTLAGGQSALARQLSISQGLVWQWLNGKQAVTAERCVAIESATEGAITRHDLRPDVFGPTPYTKEVGHA